MERVPNAIELKPYQLRHAADADRVLRSALRDKTNPDDFPDPDAPDGIDLDTAVPSTNSALPRWQQRMEAVEGAPAEPGLDDTRSAAADAHHCQPLAPVRVAD